ncbi:hypothetical protein FHX09_003141 [Rhizobium sp. BK538]|nr:hypothetical protein [Rhizobium sp. BK538]TCM61829.1 hypothetical protein EV291_1566 [Rhizobium sp. BK068]
MNPKLGGSLSNSSYLFFERSNPVMAFSRGHTPELIILSVHTLNSLR